MPKKYDAATEERAVRMVQEPLGEYDPLTEAYAAVVGRLGLPEGDCPSPGPHSFGMSP